MKTVLIPLPKTVDLHPGACPADAPVTRRTDPALGPEAYRMELSPAGIVLTGGSDRGVLWAEQTLLQLRLGSGGALPCGVIEDEPAYPWRSFHLDCSRHFFSLQEVKKMVRAAACFKLNRLHWHISDDQGWRIESKAFPKLHEIGSQRAGDTFGNFDSHEPYGGYYTRDEVRELVTYCKELGIEVVPEIDVPGHVSAILAAYPDLSCTGAPVAVQTEGGIFPDILCAGKESVFAFLEALLDDVLELFPGDTVHIGGDEAPKTRWKECPHCQERMRQEGLENLQQLQGWFLNRVAAFLKTRDKRAVVWNEAAYGGNLDPELLLQFWFQDRDGQVRRHAEKGGQVILSPIRSAYCDYPHAAITLENVYTQDLAPEDLPAGAVLGTECLAWAEYLRTDRELERKAWPRYAASAEAGWCGPRREDFPAFQARLRELFPLFAQLGVDATEPDSWNPASPGAQAEMEAFKENFTPELMARYRSAQQDI